MWDRIADPPAALLEVFLLGVLLSLVYDLFRVRRTLLPLPCAVIFAEDVIYCMFSAGAFFLVLMDLGNGELRWWLLPPLLAGWLACHFTVGLVIVNIVRLLLYLLRLTVYAAVRFLLRPVIRFGAWSWRKCRSHSRKNSEKRRAAHGKKNRSGT